LRDNNVIIEGPAIVLTSEAVQAVAIVLHELATNAAMNGALSSRHGQVSVCWRRQPNGASGAGVVLEWREIGGPPVKVLGALGYGTSVIRELIPYELGGTVDYLLAPAGVACLLEIPAKWLRDETMGQQDMSGHGDKITLLH
jgi:two-component sensor histidine kinase